MRIFVFFDLPVVKEKQRKRYTQFRKFLLNDGFDMLQYSVYSRICSNLESTKKHINRIYVESPKDGSVRIMTVTERQYEQMIVVVGQKTPREKHLKNNMISIF